MENNKNTATVIDSIAEVIKEEIETTNSLTKQEFKITVEYLKHCVIITADALDVNFRIKTDSYLCDPEVVIIGDIDEAIKEIVADR